jgi:hypothetical protein
VVVDIKKRIYRHWEFKKRFGDYCFAVLDINSEALVGDSLLKIIHPAARRLSCNIPLAVAK